MKLRKRFLDLHPCPEAKRFVETCDSHQNAWDTCKYAHWMLYVLWKTKHKDWLTVALSLAGKGGNRKRLERYAEDKDFDKFLEGGDVEAIYTSKLDYLVDVVISGENKSFAFFSPFAGCQAWRIRKLVPVCPK